MDLPNGKLVKRVDLTQTGFGSVFNALQDKGFTGYAAVCCHGKSGLEEGIVFFDSGKGVGAHYEYLKLEKEVDGEPAFARCVNASKAGAAVLDLVQLTRDQVHGVLAQNAGVLFVSTPESVKKHEKKNFSEVFEEEMSGLTKKKRSELLRKYRLNVSIALPTPKKEVEEAVAQPGKSGEVEGRISIPPLEEPK